MWKSHIHIQLTTLKDIFLSMGQFFEHFLITWKEKFQPNVNCQIDMSPFLFRLFNGIGWSHTRGLTVLVFDHLSRFERSVIDQ